MVVKFLRRLSDMSDENLRVLCTVHLDYNLFYQQQLQPPSAGPASGSGAGAPLVPRLPLSLTPDSGTPLVGSARTQPSASRTAGDTGLAKIANAAATASAAPSSNAGAAGSNAAPRSSNRLPPTGRRSASARRAWSFRITLNHPHNLFELKLMRITNHAIMSSIFIIAIEALTLYSTVLLSAFPLLRARLPHYLFIFLFYTYSDFMNQ